MTLQVYTVMKDNEVEVYSTIHKALDDILDDDVDIGLNGKLVRVIGNVKREEIVERMKKGRVVQYFSFDGEDIWLERKVVR